MLSEIELMANDIGILNHGRLLFEGSLDELRRNALQAGFAADNLEEMFLSMIDNDNTTRKQRAKPVSYTHLDVYKRQVYYLWHRIIYTLCLEHRNIIPFCL